MMHPPSPLMVVSAGQRSADKSGRNFGWAAEAVIDRGS